jgi:hypothetical protein
LTLPWQTYADMVPVPSRIAGFWTLVLEFVPGARLLRVRVLSADANGAQLNTQWSPADNIHCGPDGYPNDTKRTNLLCSSAAYGALIGKIGGSTADVPDSSAGSAGPYPGRKVFAVGSDCIVTLPSAADGGPLFLTMNDQPCSFEHHAGGLFVTVEYFPL